jgi:pyridoxine 5-phosphate synthase
MGEYANSESIRQRNDLLENIGSIAMAAQKLGLGVSAGRCLNFQNVSPIAMIPQIEEINVGRSMVVRALSIGMESAVRDMVALVH